MTKPKLPVLHSVTQLSASSSKSLADWGGLTDSQLVDPSYLVALNEPCPPNAARRDELLAFRLVSNNPPTKKDFMPTYKEYPHREFAAKDLCNSRGVSVFKNENAAHSMRMRFPKGLGAKVIAAGTIYEKDGKLMETRSHHHMTWWLETETPHQNFSVVEK